MITNCDPLNLNTTGLVISTGTTRQVALESIVAEIERLGTAAALTNPWTEITSGAPTPAGLQYLAKDLSGDSTTTASDLKHISIYREGKDDPDEERIIRFCAGTHGHNTLIGDRSMAGEFGAEVASSRDWGMCFTQDNSIENDQAEDKIASEGSNLTNHNQRQCMVPFALPGIDGTQDEGTTSGTIESNVRIFIFLDEDFLCIYPRADESGYNMGGAVFFEMEPVAANGWSKGDFPRLYATQFRTQGEPATSGEEMLGFFGQLIYPGDRNGSGQGAVSDGGATARWRSAQFSSLTPDITRFTPDGNIRVEQLIAQIVNYGGSTGLLGIIPHVKLIPQMAGAPTAALQSFLIGATPYIVINYFSQAIFAVPAGTYSATP